MKRTLVLAMLATAKDNFTILDFTQTTWNTQPVEKQIELAKKNGYFVLLSPPIEVDFPEIPADVVVQDNLAALNELERKVLVERERELAPIRRRRDELRQISFQGAEEGQTFVGKDSPAPAMESSDFDDGTQF